MGDRAATTVLGPPDEIRRRWESSPHEHVDAADASVTFVPAPGDRGTEIHVVLRRTARGGKLGEMVQKVAGTEPLAKVKDELRRFKQEVETGEVPRSDGTPTGESLEQKRKQRPAQPVAEEAGVA
jgi:uncharacterized membrane protein